MSCAFSGSHCSLDNGVGIGKVALQKKHEECQRVGALPHEQHPLTFLFRQILVKKQKVVAEIEISFPWIPRLRDAPPT